MELRPGYKQTEVGVIPEEWTNARIVDLDPFVTSGSRGWAEFYSDRGAPFIRITNLSRKSIYLDLTDLKLVNIPSGSSEGTRTQLQNGDILVSITADIGIIGYVDNTVPKPAYINQHIALVRFADNKADSRFVSYFLVYENSQRLFRGSTDVGAKAGMSLGQVLKIGLALPPLPEQRAIATALGDVDALIDAQDQLIAKKRDLKQAAMQRLLTGRERLPGFGGRWERRQLGDIAGINMGQSPRSSSYNTKGHGVPLIQGNADIEERKTIARVFTTEVTKRCLSGDLIMSVRAPVGHIARATFDACLGRGVCAIRYQNDYLYHYLISQESSWSKLSKGSTFDSVNSSDVRTLEVHLPINEEEQISIAAVLSDMDAEIAALEAQRDKTRALKQGMMQELLTGRTRLV
jgi:type I restriction enzyme, S subunit